MCTKCNKIDACEALNYFETIRWDKSVSCPFCNTENPYTTNRGYKCRNKDCHKKFTVKTNTLLSDSKIDLFLWFKSIKLYCANKFNITEENIVKEINIHENSAHVILKKIKLVDENIVCLENKCQICSISDGLTSLPKKQARDIVKDYSYSKYHITGDFNLSNPSDCNKLKKYIRLRLKYCRYIYSNTINPDEILSEVFIRILGELGTSSAKAEYMVKICNRVISKMWYEYVKSHPQKYRKLLERVKNTKRKGRENIDNWYIAELLRRRKRNKGKQINVNTLLDNRDLIIYMKESVTKHREL